MPEGIEDIVGPGLACPAFSVYHKNIEASPYRAKRQGRALLCKSIAKLAMCRLQPMKFCAGKGEMPCKQR